MNRILSIASVAVALISVLIVQYMGGAVQQVTVGIPSPPIALQSEAADPAIVASPDSSFAAIDALGSWPADARR